MARLLMLLVFIASSAAAQASRTSTPTPQPAAEGARSDDRDAGSDKELPCPQGQRRTAEARFAQYLIRTYRSSELEGCLQVLKSGAVVYSLVSGDFKIGNNFEGGALIPVGTDITGAGNPTRL